MNQKLHRLKARPRKGDERFHYEGWDAAFSVLDFWRWTMSDLVSNSTRGLVAEFIVAKAFGVDCNEIRDPWAPYDLITPEGLKIEVKSAAYLQSWQQRKVSSIRFNIPATKAWNPEAGNFDSRVKRQADAYVFALLAHEDKQSLDPLDLDQWKFYVLTRDSLNTLGEQCRSIGLKKVEELGGGAVEFRDLRGKLVHSKLSPSAPVE